MATLRKKHDTVKSVNTEIVQIIPPRREHLYKPGQSGNPAGRKKGSRNKLGEAFLSELLADFEDYGAAAIADCRKEDPAAYCRIIAAIIPKELDTTDEERLLEKFLEEFTTVEEIKEFRKTIGHLALEQSAGEEGAATATRRKSNRV